MGKCLSRTRQSPVNFGRDDIANPISAGSLPYHYNLVDEPFRFENDGRTYSAALSGFGTGGMAYEEAWYDLVNVNIHAVSEHTWVGEHMPVELQLVHKRSDGDALLIVALPISSPNPPAAPVPAGEPAVPVAAAMVPASPGPAPASPGPALSSAGAPSPSIAAVFPAPAPAPVATPAGAPGPAGAPAPAAAGASYVPPPATDPAFNPMVQPLLWAAPPAPQTSSAVQTTSANPWDLNQLVQGGTYLEYHGSLTAPPCTDIATWLVRLSPVMASDAQVNALMGAVYATNGGIGNYRAEMPLSGETLRAWTTTYTPDPLAAVDSAASVAGGAMTTTTKQPTPSEVEALRQAHAALSTAKQITEHVDALEKQLFDTTTTTTTTQPAPIEVVAAAMGDVQDAALAKASQDISASTDSIAQQAAQAAVTAAMAAR